jgi:multidrug efflux pump subunit AcrA (membrane-fusion protein)
LLVFVFAPVRMTVLATGELVPAQPVVVRAPIEGVIGRFHVQPNQMVQVGQLLFEFDEALLKSRVEVAHQSLETAQAQYRQTSQLALDDAKYKAELAAVAGVIQERRSEYNFLKSQLQRGAVIATGSGMALFDDPLTWVGKPVTVGEQIMRIARPDDVEVQAWLPLDDVVNLPSGSALTLYLQSNPLSPVQAHLSYLSHEAVLRPDGSYAFRVRARPVQVTSHSVGQKGTAKISGEWTFLSYWLLRKPLALLRTTLGI